MKLYPVYLKLKGVSCLVVGGGIVALRKVKALVLSQAKVIVISPKLCKGLDRLRQKKVISYKKAKFHKRFLKGVKFVFAATDNQQVNLQVARDCQKQGLLVNIVDTPKLCNFYVPSVLRNKDILVSISTQGIFPGIAKRIKEECFPVIDKYARSLRAFSTLRNQIKKEFQNKKTRKEIMQSLLKPQVLFLVEKKQIQNINDLKAYLNIF